jgi:hypothetical protein
VIDLPTGRANSRPFLAFSEKGIRYSIASPAVDEVSCELHLTIMIPHLTSAYRALVTGLHAFFLLQAQVIAAEKIIEQVNLHDEPLSEVADYLRKVSADLSGGKERNVLLDPKVDPNIKITLSLQKVSLSTVLGYVAEVSGLDYRVDKHAIVFTHRRGPNAQSLSGLRRMSVWVSKRIQAVRFKQIDFHEEPLSDVAAFLAKRSLELDPEKKGVNIVLSKGVDPTTLITLKLSDVPMASVLKYVSRATDLRIRVDGNAVVFLQSKK